MSRNFMSAIAISAAMLVAGPSFAQMAATTPFMPSATPTINGVAVVEADIAAVQARCDELKLVATTTSPETQQMPSNNNMGNAATETTPPVQGMAQAITTIDLETVTLEACVEGGLVEGPVAQ